MERVVMGFLFEALREIVMFIPRFWDGAIAFISGFIPFTPLSMVILIAVYGVGSFFIYKLSMKFIIIPMNNHMRANNFSVGTNKWLYIIALAMLVFDVIAFAPAGGGTGVIDETTGNVTVTVFALAALLFVIIAFVRALIKTKLRFFYLQPFQFVFFAYLYLLILLAFPAVVIYMAAVFFAGALSGMGASPKCDGCGRIYKQGGTCRHCGGSVY
jgi:hypothetical protein